MDRVIEKKTNPLSQYKIPIAIVAVLALGWFGYQFVTKIGVLRVERDEVRIGEIKRGEFTVTVLGSGVVVPSDIEFVLPKSDAQVKAVLVESGDEVALGQPLFTFTNEGLMTDLAAGKLQVAEAKASLASKEFDLGAMEIDLESQVMQKDSEFQVSQAKYLALAELMRQKVPPVSLLDFRESKIVAEQKSKQKELAQKRLDNFKDSKQSQLEQFRLKMAVARSALASVQEKVDALTLTASKAGVIQEVTLKPGQRVNESVVLAKIVNPKDVVMRLKVPALHGGKLKPGQNSTITVNSRELLGKLVRVDPNVTGASLEVDVALNEHADFLRPNMHVLGEIEVTKLPNALFVDKPANAVENGNVMLYVLENNSAANYTQIQLGQFSSQYVEVVGGVNVGDKIILSDLSKANGASSILLN